jgi:hypothetical protein
MAVTYTASSQSATPRVVHTGVIPAYGTFTLNGVNSTSVSDLMLMVRIPDRAWILNGYITGTIGNVGSTIKVGTSADDDCCIAAASISLTSQMNRFNSGVLPFQVSISDDSEPKWTWLRAEVVTSPSSCLTMSVKVFVEYAMPGAVFPGT